jgi:hypothetical protein
MQGTTECSDVVHFLVLWAAVAVVLGRRIWMDVGDIIYPNVYLAFFGPSGDRKTTGQRRIWRCRLLESEPNIPIIQSGGSTEGIADRLIAAPEGRYLFAWEEFATFLATARWGGATLLEFLTETFDCPDEWSRIFRKNPVTLTTPTPTVLTMTTAEWFWRHAKPEDFYGGFGNRFLFFCGTKKPPIAAPTKINGAIIHDIKGKLSYSPNKTYNTGARWTLDASRLWDKFYCKFELRERNGLLSVALKRAHVYITKLSIIYAYLDGTYPEVLPEQLQAAIAVITYAIKSTELLLDMRATQNEDFRELEHRILSWLTKHDGEPLRILHQRLCKHRGDSETFNRVVKSLVASDQIEIQEAGLGKKRKHVYVVK